MALRASHGGVSAGQWERSVVVIERRRLPRAAVVAQLALLREAGGHVVRVGRGVEVRQVAGNAGRIGQAVVAVDVTLDALQVGVRSGQGESCGIVVEGCPGPGGGGMA